MSDRLSALGRVLLLHAHPDDETLATGPLLAELAARDVDCGLLTATRGEMGEIVPGVAADLPDGLPLTEIRDRELAAACEVFGVGWRAYLGMPPARAAGRAPRRYADSGMEWIRPGLAGPAASVGPEALTSAPLAEVIADLGAAVAAYEPQVLVTYADDGGYGHPDHLRCFEAAVAFCRESGLPLMLIEPRRDDEPVTGDAIVVDARDRLPVIKRALDAHRTQVRVDGDDLVHSGGQREAILTRLALRPAVL